MKKDLNLIHNVAFLISELEEYVDELDLSIYDDYSEMKSAQKEVLKHGNQLQLGVVPCGYAGDQSCSCQSCC